MASLTAHLWNSWDFQRSHCQKPLTCNIFPPPISQSLSLCIGLCVCLSFTHTHTHTPLSLQAHQDHEISSTFKNKSVTSINHEKQSVNWQQGWELCHIRVWTKLELTGGFIPTITLTFRETQWQREACLYSLLPATLSWLCSHNKAEGTSHVALRSRRILRRR